MWGRVAKSPFLWVGYLKFRGTQDKVSHSDFLLIINRRSDSLSWKLNYISQHALQYVVLILTTLRKCSSVVEKGPYQCRNERGIPWNSEELRQDPLIRFSLPAVVDKALKDP